jgi:hypothetical protein
MYVLDTRIDPRDAFVVAVKAAFKEAGLELATQPGAQAPDEQSAVRLEMQVDGVTAGLSIPLLDPPRRQEFLEDNPDMLRIALGQFLVRQFRKAAR